MKTSLQGVVFFCEDIRDEVGDKNSFMGLLGPEVWVDDNDKVTPIFCVFLLWATGPSVVVSATFETTNAPEKMVVPRPFERTLAKDPDNDQDTWLVLVKGRLRCRVGEEPLSITARFAVGDQVFFNKLTLERERSEG